MPICTLKHCLTSFLDKVENKIERPKTFEIREEYRTAFKTPVDDIALT